ncbi:unnamed protein product [Phytophthora fragariaefolia]|uniref:Unnamed protein product n=1 Tax=Phytophthora fragariaefolia TaxID=1490495 RepID=A0A9W7CYP0_9STRA|nr:unnamed protein product [Phytophthora fragariaefolia]
MMRIIQKAPRSVTIDLIGDDGSEPLQHDTDLQDRNQGDHDHGDTSELPLIEDKDNAQQKAEQVNRVRDQDIKVEKSQSQMMMMITYKNMKKKALRSFTCR